MKKNYTLKTKNKTNYCYQTNSKMTRKRERAPTNNNNKMKNTNVFRDVQLNNSNLLIQRFYFSFPFSRLVNALNPRSLQDIIFFHDVLFLFVSFFFLLFFFLLLVFMLLFLLMLLMLLLLLPLLLLIETACTYKYTPRTYTHALKQKGIKQKQCGWISNAKLV